VYSDYSRHPTSIANLRIRVTHSPHSALGSSGIRVRGIHIEFRVQSQTNCKKAFHIATGLIYLRVRFYLSSYLIFNSYSSYRRRRGELEHVLIKDFEKYVSLNKNNYPNLFNTLPEEIKILAKKYVRFAIRGKLERFVLLSVNLVQCIEMILNHRKNAKVSEKNPYIFGLSSVISNRYKYLRACDFMREYSSACEARVPYSL